jgi:hypothetical protein
MMWQPKSLMLPPLPELSKVSWDSIIPPWWATLPFDWFRAHQFAQKALVSCRGTHFIASCQNKISTQIVSLAVSVPIVLTCLPPVLTPPTSPTIPSQSVPFHCSPPQLPNTETRCPRWLLLPTLPTTSLLDLTKAGVSMDRSALLVRRAHLQFVEKLI